MQKIVLNGQEIRIVSVLASIFSLRMLGIFMLLPVFTIEAHQYLGSTPALVGLAVGLYGLSQAVMQVPFGMLSDKFGRKALIILGLLLIFLGSAIASLATNVQGLIIGRILQGCGAMGSVVIASLADNTREQVRSVAMAIIGASIGIAFAVAMVLGAWLNQKLGLSGIFAVTAALSLLGIFLVLFIPNSVAQTEPKASNWLQAIKSVFTNRTLACVNYGVFVLHASLAALFLVIPWLLQSANISNVKLWKFYLVVLIIAMFWALRMLMQAQQQLQLQRLQTLAILALLISIGLLYTIESGWLLAGNLTLFFTAFCVLEASLPASVAKYAPVEHRGTALGMYSSLQFLGIFIGGSVGGWLQARFGIPAVLLFCGILVSGWLALSTHEVKDLIKLRGRLWHGV